MTSAIMTQQDWQQVVATPQQVSSELSGEAVILHLESGVYFGLNEVGAFIWQLIQTPLSLAEICDAVMAEYEVDAATCEQDTRSLLTALAEAGLLGDPES